MFKEILKKTVRFSISFMVVIFIVGFATNINANNYLSENIQQEAQSFTEFKGIVIDSNSKDPLVFADISVKGTNIRTVSNNEGEFVLKIPNELLNSVIVISYLGYETQEISIRDLESRNNKIALNPSITLLNQVQIKVPKDALALVKAALNRAGEYYYNDQALMTAFYRETIKKGNKNASLTEAVVEVYKEPYASKRPDAINLIKSRKNTNYSRLDTIALKLQGGPFSTLYSDIVKYPEYIFTENTLPYYEFSFEPSTQINDRQVYVVKFNQQSNIVSPFYAGKLFIDAETFALTSAIYSLNVENRELASEMFVRKKPNKVRVYPVEANYRVDYKTKNGKWYYGYSNIQLEFNVKWKNRLFGSNYTLSIEMAITDWEKNISGKDKPINTLKPSIILSDEASGFSDPEFWGEYNIIEPEKSIESAINKITRQLKREQS